MDGEQRKKGKEIKQGVLIGTGGMGNVYRVPKKFARGMWAVKEVLLSKERQQREQQVAFVVNQTQCIQSIPCKQIAKVRKIKETDEKLYLYMDYIEGISLLEQLQQCGPMTEQMVIEIGIQLCTILDAFHTHSPKMIYRDLKPANIRMNPKGNVFLVDLDFVWISGRNSRWDQMTLGTKGYAAPEQYGRGNTLEEQTDIYALGMTLLELLTGEPPWKQNSIWIWLEEVSKDYSDSLIHIIKKCIRLQEEGTYYSCKDVKMELKKIIKRCFFVTNK